MKGPAYTETVDAMVGRLLGRFADLDDAEKMAGHAWYPQVRGVAQAIARDYEVSSEAVAGMIAAYSPRMPWSRNVDVVVDHLENRGTKPRGVFARSHERADRILRGEPIDQVLNGPKVWRFYLSIVDPYGPWACIDVWAIRAAMPDGITSKDIKQCTENKRNGRPISAWIEDAYLIAARVVGWPAPAFQAAVWVGVRGGAE